MKPKSIPENFYKQWTKEVLNEFGVAHWPIAAGGFGGHAGMPDRIAVLPPHGQLLALEFKGADYVKGVWRPRPLRANQNAVLRKMRLSGAITIVLSSDTAADLLDVLEYRRKDLLHNGHQSAFFALCALYKKRLDLKHVVGI